MIDYNNIDWAERFTVSPESPSGLVYRVNVYTGRTGKSLIKSAGDFAGCMSCKKDGSPKSWEVGYNSKLYKVHRIVYVLFHGKIENDLVVDHIDGNPFNNRVENLRLVHKAVNHRNAKKFSNNTSGHAGVYWQEMNKGKHLYAVAEAMFMGKKFVKCFGTHKYDDPLKEAILWREEKLAELNAEYGAGYTQRHGS